MPQKRKVYQYDLSGNLVKEHESIKKAHEYLGLKSNANMSFYDAEKRQREWNGYLWSFKSPEEFNKTKQQVIIEALRKKAKEVEGQLKAVRQTIKSLESSAPSNQT